MFYLVILNSSGCSLRYLELRGRLHLHKGPSVETFPPEDRRKSRAKSIELLRSQLKLYEYKALHKCCYIFEGLEL